LHFWASSQATSFDIANNVSGVTTLETSTTYYVKTLFDGESYKVLLSLTGEFSGEETVEISVTSSALIYQSNSIYDSVGATSGSLNNSFNGSIDFSKSHIKINGKIWWRGYANCIRKDTEQYGDYDYVVNVSDVSFRLPIKVALIGGGHAPVLTDTNLGTTSRLRFYNINGDPITASDSGQNVSMASSRVFMNANGNAGGGAGPDLYTKMTADLSRATNDNLKLYFYVGETVQDANLIEIGKIMEQLAKIDYVVESKVATESDPTWYRVYKSGWIEQGGETNIGIITYPKAFNDTNYNLQVTPHVNQSAQVYWNDFGYDLTTTGFKLRLDNYKTQWRACGQGA
jgi:hypothetical protein